jgi:hypothetical protein
LTVIDLDGSAGAATWRALTAAYNDTTTATAATPHGRHHWYRLPDGLHVPRSIRRLGDGIDVLGDDGYAIAPPSAITRCPKQHDEGEHCETRYAWASANRRLTPLPVWIPRRLEERARLADQPACATPWQPAAPGRAPVPSSGGRVRYPRRYALAALRGEAARVRRAPAGERNDTLNYAAWRLVRHLRDGALTEAEIRDALSRAADACDLVGDDGARAVHTTITSALRSGGRSL